MRSCSHACHCAWHASGRAVRAIAIERGNRLVTQAAGRAMCHRGPRRHGGTFFAAMPPRYTSQVIRVGHERRRGAHAFPGQPQPALQAQAASRPSISIS
eukprot:scaffold332_cov105-Isochrysis_galbana.AAC.3